MKIVIDANILFAALIKKGVNAEIIFNEDFELHAPSFIVDEFLKYEKLILRKTKRTKGEFDEIMIFLKEVIKIIPEDEYLIFLKGNSLL